MLIITGCKHNAPNPVIITETQEVIKPVFVCPSELNNIQQPSRPILLIDLLTDEDSKDPGKVAKYYKVTIKQLLNYATDLEQVNTIQTKACEGLPSVIVPHE